ncbi:OsmC family peroxiredoxin [Marinicauda algicola]|uniref:OsmC family peroxiredoxin n=1 Tax=Marinicauda algicola TaxID=2029849 RepID=A0A4S2GX64_9PROT|nr:OsmC family protein [Marinicauda algicola]TGY87656.1 OsmC family peroxiredoxin [Marinicauda algicola]
MKRTASAVWTGDLKTGKGRLTTGSGVLDGKAYGFRTRFEDEPGTNPEELIGAAHAGCYAMALSMILGQKDLTAEVINAKADVTIEQVEGDFAITRSHLTVRAKVPGASEDAFRQAAEAARKGCPVSKVLKAEITMDASLEG